MSVAKRKRSTVGRAAWHVHHDRLVEFLTEPIETRKTYIRREKPKNEQALRLRLLRVVKGRLPVAVAQAWQAYEQAWQVAEQAWQAYDQARQVAEQAWQAYDQARQVAEQAWQAYGQARQVADQARQAALIAHQVEILTLHAKECKNCPWNGRTIFSKGKVGGRGRFSPRKSG